jgi:hypothetical protein
MELAISVGSALSKWLNRVDVVGVNAPEGCFCDHCSTIRFTNVTAMILVEVDESMEQDGCQVSNLVFI